MPQNFRFIPLICAALPEAKIIHVQRNASATCWSNYKQYFVSNSLSYCYDLKDVTEYYNLYNDLMKIWEASFGDKIYNLNYESLTTNQENKTRKLIKHLKLNWEDACLKPHKNKRSVRTASQQQVRQKFIRKLWGMVQIQTIFKRRFWLSRRFMSWNDGIYLRRSITEGYWGS